MILSSANKYIKEKQNTKVIIHSIIPNGIVFVFPTILEIKKNRFKTISVMVSPIKIKLGIPSFILFYLKFHLRKSLL